jgi:HEAT repeat protein
MSSVAGRWIILSGVEEEEAAAALDAHIAALIAPAPERAKAEGALVNAGLPALRRLIAVADGEVAIPWPDHSDVRDIADAVTGALTTLARAHPDAFLEALLARPQPVESLSLLWVVGAVDDPRVEPLLLAALEGRHFSVRWAAVLGLHRRPPQATIARALADAACDPDETVAQAAVRALGDVGDAYSLELLRDWAARVDPHRPWRARAAREAADRLAVRLLV